jgi:hypothetical protein
MKQMDMLFNMSPIINAYVRLFDDNYDAFKNPNKVKTDIEAFLRNLKKYNMEGGFLERRIAQLYSQAMRVIVMPSPALAFRNLFQNAAFEHDKSILIDPRNKKLSKSELDYIETYVYQQRAMVEEYFMANQPALPGLKTLTALIDKIKIYPYSDMANRHWSFWAKKNQVDRALKSANIKDMMKRARFNDMSDLEQKRALSILARDGREAMGNYVARVHTDDIHFLYERAQRSPAEMTSLGRVLGNLALFPRAYAEKLAHQANTLLSTKTSLDQKRRALKIMFSVIAGGMVVGAIFQKVTGRKKNPYDPLQILSFRVGGLTLAATETINEVYLNTIMAAQGDEIALGKLTTLIPETANMFVPFYDYVLRGIEASTDTKNIDREALRKIREIVDKDYERRPDAYKLDRNTIEAWQYFLFGAGIDEKVKERLMGDKADLYIQVE